MSFYHNSFVAIAKGTGVLSTDRDPSMLTSYKSYEAAGPISTPSSPEWDIIYGFKELQNLITIMTVSPRAQPVLEGFVTLPSRLLQVGNTVHGPLLVRGVFRCVRIWVILLFEIAKRVIDFAMLGFVGPHVQQKVTHFAVTFGHLPIING